MSLVAYSDSEGSEDEQPQTSANKPISKSAAPPTNTNFAVSKENPKRIQVKLPDVRADGESDGPPAAKRPRVGGGAFGGFNAMLPPPKRDDDTKAAAKPTTRKVFSLKTGAEPGFSRESDAELRQLFAEQDTRLDGTERSSSKDGDSTGTSTTQDTNTAVNDATEPVLKGNPFMFKPLSVARNKKKAPRKAIAPVSAQRPSQPNSSTLNAHATETSWGQSTNPSSSAAEKVNLFSINQQEPEKLPPEQEEEDEIIEVMDEPYGDETSDWHAHPVPTTPDPSQAQSLDTIASDLNLSKAERRQLFGRHGQPAGKAINVVNFNTDQEYMANEALRASGEQAQHNPVRGIAPGKHSLKQLVNAASGQKDALEESFASGRRNKKEAGNKYGW